MTTKQYLARLRTFVLNVGKKMGCDLSRSPKDLRVAVLAILLIIAVLIRMHTVVKGTYTNAELLDEFQAAEDDSYDDEPRDPPPLEI